MDAKIGLYDFLSLLEGADIEITKDIQADEGNFNAVGFFLDNPVSPKTGHLLNNASGVAGKIGTLVYNLIKQKEYHKYSKLDGGSLRMYAIFPIWNYFLNEWQQAIKDSRSVPCSINVDYEKAIRTISYFLKYAYGKHREIKVDDAFSTAIANTIISNIRLKYENKKCTRLQQNRAAKVYKNAISGKSAYIDFYKHDPRAKNNNISPEELSKIIGI